MTCDTVGWEGVVFQTSTNEAMLYLRKRRNLLVARLPSRPSQRRALKSKRSLQLRPAPNPKSRSQLSLRPSLLNRRFPIPIPRRKLTILLTMGRPRRTLLQSLLLGNFRIFLVVNVVAECVIVGFYTGEVTALLAFANLCPDLPRHPIKVQTGPSRCRTGSRGGSLEGQQCTGRHHRKPQRGRVQAPPIYVKSCVRLLEL